MKHVIRIGILLSALGVGALTLYYGLGWGWAILLTIVSWFGVAILYGATGQYLPIFLQRPLYEEWRRRAESVELSPLVAFPFHAYLAFENEAEFKKGGWKHAQAHAMKWMEEYPEKFAKAIEPVVEAKRRQLEAKEEAKEN